jgi:tetratricopeptide (TPR) repeat protein
MAKSRSKLKRTSGQVTTAPGTLATSAARLATTWRFWLPRVLVIAGLTLWIYWPALGGGWIWDDTWYVTENTLLHDTAGLWKFWFQPGSWIEFYPLEETVMWVEWHLFGDNTLGYHLTSLILHVINSLLVWRLLAKFNLRLAWLGGLIFAVHPVQVESVAWISELKNTLSLPFYLLAMTSWIDYEEHKKKEDYQQALIFFLAGMLCKITMAPFPLIILLYAWWKRSRIDWKDVNASGPFFLVSIGLGIITIVASQLYLRLNSTPAEQILLGGFLPRFVRAGLILSVYFSNVFLPWGLMIAYPKWPVNLYSPLEYVPWLALALLLYWLWRKRQDWGRHALLGLLFFLLTLAPFLGFVSISYMDFTWVLDHLLYIPSIGLIGLVVAALGSLRARLSPRLRFYGLGCISLAILLMAMASRTSAMLFRNDETLWAYVLRNNPNNMWAHHNMGHDLLIKGRYPEALAQFEDAVALAPNFSDGYYSIGLVLEKMGEIKQAQAQFQHGLLLNPDNAGIYDALGGLARREGDFVHAQELYQHALHLQPNDAVAYINLGDILIHDGHGSEAIDSYQHALELNPDLPQLRYNLGNALLQAGRFSEAVDQLKVAVILDPNIAAAHGNLGIALATLGRMPEAIEQLEAALAINPQLVQVHDNLARAYVQTGRIEEGIGQFQQAIQINPNDSNARDNLARLQQFEWQKTTSGKN